MVYESVQKCNGRTYILVARLMRIRETYNLGNLGCRVLTILALTSLYEQHGVKQFFRIPRVADLELRF